MKYLQHNRNFV